MKKKIIRVDEEKCIGCGLCVPDCHQGVLEIIDGKAKVVRESSCDGLGNCLGSCPQDALHIEEVEVEQDNLPCGCPGTMVQDFSNDSADDTDIDDFDGKDLKSELRQWPVQLKLVPPSAPYFNNSDLVVAADCVSYSFANFHKRFLKGKSLVVFCPKLDDAFEAYTEKLTEVFKNNNIYSVTVVKMEVPCCMGTLSIVEESLKASGKNIILKEYTISLKGEIV